MNKKYGFTLVELLAVIVILAIVLVIAVPQIMNVIAESRKGALASSAKLIASSAESMKISNDTLGIDKVLTCSDLAKINDEDYSSCIISFDDNGKAKVTIIGKGKLEGMCVLSATKENVEVVSNCETMTACFSYTSSNAGVTINDYDVDNIDECPKDVIIPSKIENKEVIAIGYGAFADSQLTSVVIPNSVTRIVGHAFRNNQLTSLTIPNSIATIGERAFSSNQLISLSIPNSVTTIELGAFADNQLTSVTIPNSVTTIGNQAFRDNQLTSVNISDNVTTINDYAFFNNQLTSVTIPDGVTTIGTNAFYGNQLTSVTIPNSVTTIGSGAFQYNQLTSVNIPDGATTIGANAFSGNKLTSVTIPYSVATIGNKAFYKTTTSNPNLISIINTTEKEFDWNDIITGSSGTASVTGTYNGVSVTTE